MVSDLKERLKDNSAPFVIRTNPQNLTILNDEWVVLLVKQTTQVGNPFDLPSSLTSAKQHPCSHGTNLSRKNRKSLSMEDLPPPYHNPQVTNQTYTRRERRNYKN
eukprot:Protomagalhaensia_wolfi_Nauph_80__2534@NODE_2695_length_1013_cov_1674_206366_g2109_i0_p1_GENE_NODE_2695_length_1013_cov_1674_206366_g2109_i0NODE_2695_length_1013_cov_1674_206366_g2109_i0_p1_ORF_typecomplete_len105_score14_63_NODE_2695_length_1013_cov_1674_206366_g2109_i0321635